MEINKIYNEDCKITLAKMADKSVDLVVTSPPYNMRTRIRNGKYTSREKSEHFSKKYKHFSDDLPIDVFYEFHKNTLQELLRVSKVVCYNFQIVTGSKEAFFKIIGDFSQYIKDIIIWDKGSGQPAMHENVLNSCYEMILILESDSKCGRVINNAKFERGCMNNILRVGRGKKTNNINSAVFPEELPKILIESFSKKNDVVYDPFAGSGTTLVVAKKLDRYFIGSELIKECYELAIENLKNSEMPLFLDFFEKKVA